MKSGYFQQGWYGMVGWTQNDSSDPVFRFMALPATVNFWRLHSLQTKRSSSWIFLLLLYTSYLIGEGGFLSFLISVQMAWGDRDKMGTW